MRRTQIMLEEAQYQFLRSQARRTGESMSALIRRAVDRLSSASAADSAELEAFLGAYEADETDVSVRHDAYFPTVPD